MSKWEGDEPMIIRSVSVPRKLWEAAQHKAGLVSISAVVRRLLEKWLKGEINLD